MTRLTLVILVVALGAVRAEAQQPNTAAALSVASGPAVLGHTLGTKLKFSSSVQGTVYLFLGQHGGSSVVTVGGTQVTVPVGGSPLLVGSSAVQGRVWAGLATLPSTSSLLGQQAAISAVVIRKGQVQIITLACGIGPIVEDGLI